MEKIKRRSDFIDRTGEKHITNEGYEIEIIECFGRRNSTARFIKNGVVLRNLQYGNIEKGQIKNPFHPSVFGIGYLGVGKYEASVNNRMTKTYSTWKSMLERCYSDKYHKIQPGYIGCSVDERWHNFQVFAEWFESNYTEGFALDKDILFKKNKVYSENTCGFVPQEINNCFIKCKRLRGSLPIGVIKDGSKFATQLRAGGKHTYLGVFDTVEKAFSIYKDAKEKHIKELATKWRYNGISNKIYESMIYYQVEITD